MKRNYMKKFFTSTILFVALSVAFTAYSAPKQESKQLAMQTQHSSVTAMEEVDGINAYDSDAGVDFKVDKTLVDKLPTGGISVYDAQKIIVKTLRPEATFQLPEGYTMLYVYRGVMHIDGKKFYHIEFGAYNEHEFLIKRTFAVSLTGELYEGVPNTDAYAPYALYAAHYDVKGEDIKTISEEAAIRRIRNAMTLMSETNAIIRREGEEIIDGEHCMTFSAGDNSADGQKYTAMRHYAVSDSGVLWYMDVVKGAKWLPFYDHVK